jgi:hypothetical protein
MKKVLIHLMNWWARPFPHINAVVLIIFASLLFNVGVAVAFHPYITEVLEILQAPKLALFIRIVSCVFLSFYCTIGCLCRILIQFFPQDFGEGTGHI